MNHPAFHDITDLKESLRLVKYWTTYWYGWKSYNKVLFICYEDLMEDKYKYIRQMADYLGYELNGNQIVEIYELHEKCKKKITTFNKGTTERYKTEMTIEMLNLCNASLSQELRDMRYEV